MLGGEKAFKSLIDKIHQKDMEIVVDMPVTYTSEFNKSIDGDLNNIQKSYFKDDKFIDLKDLKTKDCIKQK